MSTSCEDFSRSLQQQSEYFFVPPDSASAPSTPRSRQEGSRRATRRPLSFSAKLSGSPCYAGSKFSDSPTARVIPLPPTEWIYEAYNAHSDSNVMGNTIGGQSDVETSSVCSSAPSLNDVGEFTVLHAELRKAALRPPSGLRVHPLRLISTVAAS